MKPSHLEPRWADSRPSSLVPRSLRGQRASLAGTGERRTTQTGSRGVPIFFWARRTFPEKH